MKPSRIIGLDIMRAIAILMVLVFHSLVIVSPLYKIPVWGSMIHKVLALSEPLGLLGVELFFVLSGFLIGTILIKVFIKSENYGKSDIFNFYVRRWFRTLPNYWLILLANLCIYQALQMDPFSADKLRYFLFLQNLWSPQPAFFREAWSLAVEEWAYLTLPVVIFALSKIFKASPKKKIIFLTFVTYASTFLLARCSNNLSITDPLYFDSGVRKVVCYRLDAISYGLLMAYLLLFYKHRMAKIRRPLLMISIVGIVVLSFIHFVGIFSYLQLYQTSIRFRAFINIFFLSLVPLFFSLSIPYAALLTTISSKAISKAATFISKISYSMYLVHFSLLLLPMLHFGAFTIHNCIPYYLLYLAVVFGLSSVIYYYYEKPVMDLRKRFSKDDPAIISKS